MCIRDRHKGTVKDGRAVGLAEGYHENGQLSYKDNYKDGKKHGLSEVYYDNGQLSFKGCFKNDDYIDMSYCEK